MKISTVAALERINRDFYRRRASEFSDTRKQPWPGWQRVLELARQNLGTDRISILDLGCGNGRFERELGGMLKGANAEVSYLGIDASVPLLVLAARADRPTGLTARRLVAADLVGRPLAEVDSTVGFDLILNFGLMHHVPSRSARRRLLAESARRLRDGGILAVSFWQFGDKERFRRRFVPWPDRSVDGLDPQDLEPGDHLLAWGESGEVRYCHFADAQEAGILLGGLGLEPVSDFLGDGASRDLNLYHVLRKPPADSGS